jgi:hypothetical protein
MYNLFIHKFLLISMRIRSQVLMTIDLKILQMKKLKIFGSKFKFSLSMPP